MAEYTWKNLIYNPTLEEAKNAIGKECYFGSTPIGCIKNANDDKNSSVLREVRSNEFSPFITSNYGSYSCIIVKEETKKKFVPFENMDEFLNAYMRQDVTRLSPRDTTIFVRGFWLKHDSEYIQIIVFSEKTILTSYDWENFESMFEKFTLLDGSPCGKEVEDE